MDFYAGRGGVDYHARGIIAQTLQRILQVANDLMDNKALAICLLGIVLLGVKVTQGIMSRPCEDALEICHVDRCHCHELLRWVWPE